MPKYLRDSEVAAHKPPLTPQQVAAIRHEYEQRQLTQRRAFYDAAEANPLTLEQRLAVIRNNDRNLVLAAAGTGKTSVIVAKVLDLIDRGVPAAQILVLAYNTAAAEELRQRFTQRAQVLGLRADPAPCIMTFHALGRLILERSGEPVQLSAFVHDSSMREHWLTDWFMRHFQTDAKALRRWVFLFSDWRLRIVTSLRLISHQRLFQRLHSSGFLAERVALYVQCLSCLRSEGMDAEQITQRLLAAKVSGAKQHAAFLWEMLQAYSAELARQRAIDFDDMVLGATNSIQKQRFKPPWQQVLIDEFQDISGARIQLIQALIKHGPQPCLTAVGDDWQAIYRFAGGKLELTTQFDRLIGSNAQTILQKTFRYNNSIAEVAGRFVMQNPEQYKKSIQTHHTVATPQVYLLDSRAADHNNVVAQRVISIVQTIRHHDATGSIAVLARYRYLLTEAQQILSAMDSAHTVHYWTFHGAKGLEADYCILLGLNSGRMGFPSQRSAPALLEALLPHLDSYPHSEERRLFYVALTRARKKSYLLADSTAPSVFVRELLAENYPIYNSDSFAVYKVKAKK